MAVLDKRKTTFVKELSSKTKAMVLYDFLKNGKSQREIERNLVELEESDGWQAWSVIHFYGFNKDDKSKYPQLTLDSLENNIETINDLDLEALHLDNEEIMYDTVPSDNDGEDILQKVKVRIGQKKLRNATLKNYNYKCALCEITEPKLLKTSHIKAWSVSSKSERIDQTNSILLCSLHDDLFDKGLISLKDDYDVIYSNKVDFVSQKIRQDLVFRKPIRQLPNQLFLLAHRKTNGFE